MSGPGVQLAHPAQLLYINIDIDTGPRLKPIAFCGDSLNELRAFPEGARQEAGFQLYRVQRGLIPLIGSRWRRLAGAYAKFASAMRQGRTASSTSRRLQRRFTCCTHFRRRRNEQQSAMGTWQPRGFGTWRGGLDVPIKFSKPSGTPSSLRLPR